MEINHVNVATSHKRPARCAASTTAALLMGDDLRFAHTALVAGGGRERGRSPRRNTPW